MTGDSEADAGRHGPLDDDTATPLDQPDPMPNGSRPIWDLVIDDMRERDRVGRARYGTPLQAGNGRDALADAYAEALDLAVYLRQAMEERDFAMRRLQARESANARVYRDFTQEHAMTRLSLDLVREALRDLLPYAETCCPNPTNVGEENVIAKAKRLLGEAA